MALTGFNSISNAIGNGKYHYQYSYKATVPAPLTTNFFVDLNQTSGQPKYNPLASAELTAAVLTGSGNNGVYTGPTYTGDTKYLLRWQAWTNGTNVIPMHIHLLDYLLYYPLIDGDNVDLQTMDNTQTLSRYTTGQGVRLVMIATAPMANSVSCTVIYTNQSGVSGRTVTFNVIAAAGTSICATSAGTTGANTTATPFAPLAANDSGIRSIESIQFAGSVGGFLCLALVKPIAQLTLVELTVPTEKMFGFDSTAMPEIQTGAYLNFLIQRGGNGVQTANLQQELIFISG